MKKYLGHALLLVFEFMLVSAASIWGQSIVTGGIAGTVTDPTGAVVSGADITLKTEATGEQYTAKSANGGDYVFSLLKPGDYTLTTAKPGFKTASRAITVLLGTTVSGSVALEVGSGTTTIEVSADSLAQLQTENANISSNFDTQQIQNIPNPGGDVTYVAQPAPGVVMNASTGGGYGNFSTFGLPATSNLFTMNGNDYNDPFLNLNNSGFSNLLLGGNELQEVAVVNNGYTGQYGRQAAAQIDYTTKAGTNSWHGDAIYNWTGRFLNANDPFNKATSPAGGPLNPRPFENNNQWAASLGGPIKKDKAFFFLNTEGIRYIFGSVHQATTPTPAFENYVLGNLPSVAPPGDLAPTVAFYQNTFKLYNAAPGIGKAAPNANSCPGLPAAAAQLGGACTQSWSDSVSAGNKEWLLSGRVDYSFSDKDQLFGRVKFDRGVQPTYTDTINLVFNDTSNQPQNEGQLNYTHVFSPTMVNNFIGSVLWYSAIFGSTNPAPALALFPGNLAFSDGSITNLGTGSGNPGGYGQGFFFPQGRNVTQWGLVDDLSITRGSHAFKLGMNYRRDDVSDHTAQEQTLYPAVNTTLAGFANDQVASFTQYNFAESAVQPVAFYSVGFYFQDEYRVNAGLKLTLALRADRNSGGVCQHNCASLPVTPFSSMPHGADIPYNAAFPGGSFQTGLKTIIPNNEIIAVQPRIGVAWTPNSRFLGPAGSTVIRGGLGLFSDLYPGTVLSAIDTNFPVVNLWQTPGGSLAWDLNSPSSTAFPTSGVSIVQTCNAVFTNNFKTGGNLTTYQSAAPKCTNTGMPAGTVVNGMTSAQLVPALNDVSSNLQNPKYVEWNLEVQHSFGPRTIVSVNYVGNRGYDELYYNNDQNGFGFGTLPATVPDPPWVA